MLASRAKLIIGVLVLGIVAQLNAQYFMPISNLPGDSHKFRISGSGYLSTALPRENGFCPSVKVSLSIQPSLHFRTVFEYTRSPGFNNLLFNSIDIESIIFPDKNTDTYFLNLSMPFMLSEKEVALKITKLTVDPFIEAFYLTPTSSSLNAYSLEGANLSYRGITFHIGSRASWQYYPKLFRYSLGGGVYYYRTSIFDESVESFRNMFGDPYLPRVFHGLGGEVIARVNDFSVSLEAKQNLNLVHATQNRATVNGHTDIRKLSEVEGFHWNVQLGWTGEILSF